MLALKRKHEQKAATTLYGRRCTKDVIHKTDKQTGIQKHYKRCMEKNREEMIRCSSVRTKQKLRNLYLVREIQLTLTTAALLQHLCWIRHEYRTKTTMLQ